jgi:uncharacterized protein (DUF2236 family)
MLDRNSVTWRYAGDARVLPFLGSAFLLQAAHPTIAAGVADYSNFKADPFGRFQHTYGRVLEAAYADDDRVAREVREAHRTIRGTKPDGTSYNAYEPEAYFWVLATGAVVMEEVGERFLRPMTAAEKQRAFEEGRELGRRFGLRDRDMPATKAEFDGWYDWMLAERIENNETVRDVVATVRRPNPPRGFPQAMWPLPRTVAARLAWLGTMGLLRPETRERLEIPWSRADDAQLAVVAAGSRAAARLPARLFYLPVAREAFARDSARAKDPAAGGAAHPLAA